MRRAINDSICICLTPLHVLIARRIYEKKGIKFSKGIYLSYVDNDKNRFYVDEMRAFCEAVDDVLLPSEDSYGSLKHLAMYVRRLQFRLKFSAYRHVRDVYTGTSINHYLYALLSAIKFSRLVTFDDGVENIKTDSALKIKEKPSAKLFLWLSGITYGRDRMLSKSSLHYSIYNAINVYTKTEKIDLLGVTVPSKQSHPFTKVVKIFLGPPPEVSKDVADVISRSLLAIQPDGYIAHPREVIHRIQTITYIDTHLVAEHYILNLLTEDPTTTCEVYGYEGSALLNLAGMSRVKVFSVMPSESGNENIRRMMQSSGVNLMAA